jgi:hypothetical protein
MVEIEEKTDKYFKHYNFSINLLLFKKDKNELIEYLGKEKYEIEILNSYLV